MNAPPPGLTFVTVVYEAELALLDLQARSFAVHLPGPLAGRLIVLDNTARGLAAGERARLLDRYGPHAARVELLRPDDVARVPAAVGWRTQQVLKLAVAEQLGDERYVVLDAKNHLVAPPARTDFESPDGRGVVPVYGYGRHPLRPSLERVLTHLGLDPRPHLDAFTATVTPFVLDAALVRAMMRDLAERAGRPFAEEFVRRELTEFFLYTGWLLASGRELAEVFEVRPHTSPAVWPRSADVAGIRAAVAQAGERGDPVFSVHRRALAALDDAARAELSGFWVDRGLFPSAGAAGQLIDAHRAVAEAAERRQRRRELPVRLRTAARRLLPAPPGRVTGAAGGAGHP